MTNFKFVVMIFLLMVSSMGILSAQSAPTYVYSTEASEMAAQPGQYSLTVTAVFGPRAGMQTRNLRLQMFYKQSPDAVGYWLDWLAPIDVTFGVGPNHPWSGEYKAFPPFDNIPSGVYRVSDGTMTAITVVGEPFYMPSMLDNSYMRGYQITPGGDLTVTVDHRYHKSYILLWQKDGGVSVDGVLPTSSMLAEFAVTNTANLKANLTAVVFDMETMTSMTTKINTRNPFVGGRK